MTTIESGEAATRRDRRQRSIARVSAERHPATSQRLPVWPHSLRPLLANPARPWKKAVFAMQGRGKEWTEAAKDIEFLGKSVRTER